MTRIIHHEVNKCYNCPYIRIHASENNIYSYCNLNNKSIIDGDLNEIIKSIIPEWCPLPVKEE